MNAPELRPYQDETVEALRLAFRQSRKVLLQSPTGSGKQ
jgi:superfamily II DNA or RNA helicase